MNKWYERTKKTLKRNLRIKMRREIDNAREERWKLKHRDLSLISVSQFLLFVIHIVWISQSIKSGASSKSAFLII